MTDMLILLGVIISAVWLAVLSFRNRSRLISGADSVKKSCKGFSRAAIGDSLYARMLRNLERMRANHAGERCVSLRLGEAVDRPEASGEFHSLLPGDPVWVSESRSGGEFMVFSGGLHIADVSAADAGTLRNILQEATVTGTYVCEQKSWHDPSSHRVKIIVYFRDAASAADMQDEATPYRITVQGPADTIELFQN